MVYILQELSKKGAWKLKSFEISARSKLTLFYPHIWFIVWCFSGIKFVFPHHLKILSHFFLMNHTAAENPEALLSSNPFSIICFHSPLILKSCVNIPFCGYFPFSSFSFLLARNLVGIFSSKTHVLQFSELFFHFFSNGLSLFPLETSEFECWTSWMNPLIAWGVFICFTFWNISSTSSFILSIELFLSHSSFLISRSSYSQNVPVFIASYSCCMDIMSSLSEY